MSLFSSLELFECCPCACAFLSSVHECVGLQSKLHGPDFIDGPDKEDGLKLFC